MMGRHFHFHFSLDHRDPLPLLRTCLSPGEKGSHFSWTRRTVENIFFSFLPSSRCYQPLCTKTVAHSSSFSPHFRWHFFSCCQMSSFEIPETRSWELGLIDDTHCNMKSITSENRRLLFILLPCIFVPCGINKLL